MNRPILLALLIQVAYSASFNNAESPRPAVDPVVSTFYSEPDPAKTSTLILTVRSPPQLGSHQDVLEHLEKTTTFLNREHRLNAVVTTLKKYTSESQQDLVTFLEETKTKSDEVKFHALWITNKVIVEKVNASLFEELTRRPDIARIDPDEIFPLFNTEFDDDEESRSNYNKYNNESIDGQADDNQWGIEKVKAPDAWNAGITGKGIVVAVIDTGARATHNLLKTNFRRDHGWFDVNGQLEPIDEQGHGTHCIGTAAGTGGIGVAKEAQWIACRAGVTGFSKANTLRCGQWVSCPTDPKGENEDCSKAAHVVSISLGGGEGDTFFDDVIRTYIKQNIVPVIAMGNEGRKGCKTQISPGDNPDAIGVGATTNMDRIADFSSRGPNARGGIKPDVSAPGNVVRSASHESDEKLTVKSGTSMATPHVAGIVALMLQNNPSLTFAQVKTTLTKSCDSMWSRGLDCGGTHETTIPNHISGYGRINAMKCLGK